MPQPNKRDPLQNLRENDGRRNVGRDSERARRDHQTLGNEHRDELFALKRSAFVGFLFFGHDYPFAVSASILAIARARSSWNFFSNAGVSTHFSNMPLTMGPSIGSNKPVFILSSSSSM